MSRVRLLISLAAASILCAAEMPAAQRTFVSAANGNDANPCSRLFPCRNFSAAIPQTDVDGEVIVLDSGGYGVVTITQSISLISPNGVHAGITAFTAGTDAVTVDAGDTGRVVLRNLSVNSHGARFGINTDTALELTVEGCAINGFLMGIRFDPTTSGARLYVSHTTVRRSDLGILVYGAPGIRATIDSVLLHQIGSGIEVAYAEATIRDSLASGTASSVGFYARPGSKMTLEGCVSTAASFGFYAFSGGVMIMSRCAAISNHMYGVIANGGGSTIHVSDSTIAANAIGILGSSGGVVTSRGNNTVQSNTTDGAFTSVFAPN
jgi:parallel beta helix pectate lyase-like protein